jgi:hypothetical protein
MDLDNITSVFNTYGWPGIIVILVIIGLVFFINQKDKDTEKQIAQSFDKMTDTITKQNSALVSAIYKSNEKTQQNLFDLINNQLIARDVQTEETHNRSINRRLEISQEIGKVLWDLMNIYNAQRTIVMEFHNSKENLSGLSFMWYDVQYERQQRDIKCISHKSKNLQASNILPIINKINLAPGNIVLYKKEDIENLYNESPVLYSQLREIKVENIIFSGIYSESNILIGIVALEYSEGHIFHEDLIDYYDIKSKTVIISNLLQFEK